MRDSLSRIIDYNRQFRGRNAGWLPLKLDKLCASPLGFLRGTFHLFAADWPLVGDDPVGTVQPIVGDLHLENLGVFRAHKGGLVFDVNDFDETGLGSLALDLGRLATSLVLADRKTHVGRAAARIESLVDAWCKAVEELDFRPVDEHGELPGCVRRLFSDAEEASRKKWLEKRVEDGRFRPDKLPPVDAAARRTVDEAMQTLAAAWAEPLVVLDVGLHVAGTGSLGRWRYAVLVEGEKPGKELILELKEALPSSLAPDQPECVLANRRRLQSDLPDHLGDTIGGGIAFTVRELQAGETKIEAANLDENDLDALAALAGKVVGRLHRRGGAVEVRRRPLERRITAFALRYAEIVEEDHANLLANRDVYLNQLG